MIGPLHDDTTVDDDGACRSVQYADMQMPAAAIDAIWSPMHLERLARTYWRFLSRCTLGLVRVEYTDDARYVVLLRRPFVLLAFAPPEYEMDAERGVVRWRIERGVLVAPPGIDADGFLEIDIRRRPADAPGTVEPARRGRGRQLLPADRVRASRWAYAVTQSRIHVIVTYGFLRSIAKLEPRAVEGRPLRDAAARPEIDDVPDPRGPLPSERASPQSRGRAVSDA